MTPRPDYPIKVVWNSTGESETYDDALHLLQNLEEFDSNDPRFTREASVTDARGRPVHLLVRIWTGECKVRLVTDSPGAREETWVPYDPEWLIVLARDQAPQLVAPLSRCTTAFVQSEFYTNFVSSTGANQPGSPWQHRETVSLVHPDHGNLVLDVLHDGRIGGIEFYDRLFGREPTD